MASSSRRTDPLDLDGHTISGDGIAGADQIDLVFR
jgi:hypothetical protein